MILRVYQIITPAVTIFLVVLEKADIVNLEQVTYVWVAGNMCQEIYIKKAVSKC